MQKLINEIKELKAVLQMDPPTDQRVAAGWHTRKAEAALALPNKLKELANQAPKELVASFDEETAEQPNLKVDLNELFSPVTKKVEESLSRERVFGISQYMLVLGEVRSLAYDSGIDRIETPQFKDTEMCYNAGDVDRIVRRIFQEATGTRLVGDFAKKLVAKKLEETEMTEVSTVIFLNADEADKTAILQVFSKQVQVKKDTNNNKQTKNNKKKE